MEKREAYHMGKLSCHRMENGFFATDLRVNTLGESARDPHPRGSYRNGGGDSREAS